jgi:molybdopterin converting factor small subunit
MGEKWPGVRDFFARCAVAINEEIAQEGAVVPASAEVALLPPVSGGAVL